MSMKATLRLFYCRNCREPFWATMRNRERVACDKPECQAWRKKQRPRLIRKPVMPKPRPCRFCGRIYTPQDSHGGRSATCQDEACQQKKLDREVVQRAEAVRKTRQRHEKAVPEHRGHAYSRRRMKCENCGRWKLCIWTKICLDCKRAIEQGHDLDMGFYEGSHNPKAPHQPFSERSEL